MDTELECPICFEIFSKEIYLCRTGHSLCGACCKLVSSCPICQEPISDALRNRALEALISERQVAKQPECPICAIPSPRGNKLLTHMENHKFFACNGAFAYKHTFEKKGTYSEKDFVMVKCHQRFLKFCVEVKHTAEKIRFTLQNLTKSGNENLIFELKYKSSLKAQRISVTSSLSVERNGDIVNSLTISKRDFWQKNPLVFYVEVQCVICERSTASINDFIRKLADKKSSSSLNK